jgi:hypothetical protein
MVDCVANSLGGGTIKITADPSRSPSCLFSESPNRRAMDGGRLLILPPHLALTVVPKSSERCSTAPDAR